MTRKMENLQNLHVGLWLLKDCSWCQLWRGTGVALVAPTLIVAVWIAWESRRSLPDLIHNVAVCLWIAANITWMVGEFFFRDGTRDKAKLFFFAGLALLAGYYLWEAIKFCGRCLRLRGADFWDLTYREFMELPRRPQRRK